MKEIPLKAQYEMPKDLQSKLLKSPKHYLITGGAGFIGSNLVETLLRLGQMVTTLDNFSTGSKMNLEQVKNLVGKNSWERHRLIEGDITNIDLCAEACGNVDIVLHQAAIGSVPRSIADPLLTHNANATGFLNMLISARDAGVERFVYAASSSTYGDSDILPKVESVIGSPLSPYAVTKYLNELYAKVFSLCYGIETIGLRYFNVFGPRQDPDGAYAAVIPKWIGSILKGEQCVINGDGETTRDFCFVANAVQANLRSSIIDNPKAINQVYNVAFGVQTSLNSLHEILTKNLSDLVSGLFVQDPSYNDFMIGDVAHSLADISKAKKYLNYSDLIDFKTGLELTSSWFAESKLNIDSN